MADGEFLFEAGPFEMNEEMETRWPRSPSPRGGTRSSPGQRRPGKRVARTVYLGPSNVPYGHSRCEVLLVLEGYAPSNPALEAHHEPMLERLAGDLRGMGRAARSIEVVAVTPSSRTRGNGDLGDQRTAAVVQRLKELLEEGGSHPAFRRLTRRATGSSRVEIRICKQ